MPLIVWTNLASFLIVSGFIDILLASFIPLEKEIRIFLGLLGLLMLGLGIYTRSRSSHRPKP